ncbi:phosphoglycerate mutase [Rhodobacteraceae bacterium WD3A24]|nr:phosphoglycerate mutase [Rhodobacteraceae bacterium WD3A24]
MTRRLILTRHAKSSWNDPRQADFDRPLNPRGQAAAPLIGRWLAARGLVPEAVLVSSARRTLETWQRIARELPEPPEAQPVDALFHAGPVAMLRALRGLPDEVRTAMLIGHNPGLAEFALQLPAEPSPHPKFADFPTGATLVVDFDITRWADLRRGTGRIVAFLTPGDLE